MLSYLFCTDNTCIISPIQLCVTIRSCLYHPNVNKMIFQFVTEKPKINEAEIEAVYYKSIVIVTWKYNGPFSNHTTISIEQCNTTRGCMKHCVTENLDQFLVLSLGNGRTLYLVIYQDGLEAYRSRNLTARLSLQEENRGNIDWDNTILNYLYETLIMLPIININFYIKD